MTEAFICDAIAMGHPLGMSGAPLVEKAGLPFISLAGPNPPHSR